MSQQINLYDPSFRKQEKQFSARMIGQALGVVVLGLAALYSYALVQTRSAEQLARDAIAQVGAQRDQLAKLAPQAVPRGPSKVLESEVARLEGEVKARQTVLAALGTGELGNVSGFSEFLAALGRQTLPGVWLTGLDIGESGNDLRVRGRALRPDLVPAYLSALNKEPMMQGRRVTEFKLSAQTAKPAAPGAAEKPASGPERFVEFTLIAPVRISEAPAAGAAK